MAKNYTLALRKSMKQLGTYRPEYESAIAIAAQLMEQYDTQKAPIVTTLESLRKDVLTYLSALGLTPAGAKKLDAAATAKAQEDPLIAALKNLGR